MRPPTRRRLLSTAAASVAALTALAGCSGGGDDGDGDNGTTTATTTTDETTTTATTTTPPPTTTEEYAPPETEFQFVYDAEGGTVLMANTGVGDFTTENTERLDIEVDGSVAKTWELPVEGGDQNTVEADPGATVELVWVAPSGETEVVGSFDVPTS